MIGFVAVMGGCAQSAKETGFLSNYKKLEPADGNMLRYVDAGALAKYSKFIVDPVVTKFYDEKESSKLKPEDIERLQAFYYEKVTKSLTDGGIQIVTTPGPGVARIRLAITNLKAATPALNVLPQTKLTGLGLGQASSEGEIVDSVTGAQIAAAIDSETGSRLSLSGLSAWGDAESVMTGWAEKLTKRIQEARGMPTK